MHVVADFNEDGSVVIIESGGDVEIGSREPCQTGHPHTEECDICRGELLGGFEYPPDAVPLPTR